MSGHTPTPWEVDGLAISVGYNKPICVMGEIDGFESGYKPCQNWEANAAFIVEAVNSHAANEAKIEALVAALRQVRDFPYIGEKAAQQMALIARAALTSAGEK